MIINMKLDQGAYIPKRGHALDAGIDLMTPERKVIYPGESLTVDTGVHVEIPQGFFGKLESKSGLNVKHSIVSLGGVIDSGYTGSIVVKLYNFGKNKHVFEKGDKLVQMIIQPCEYPHFIKTIYLDETDRGNNGFGSTGK